MTINRVQTVPELLAQLNRQLRRNDSMETCKVYLIHGQTSIEIKSLRELQLINVADRIEIKRKSSQDIAAVFLIHQQQQQQQQQHQQPQRLQTELRDIPQSQFCGNNNHFISSAASTSSQNTLDTLSTLPIFTTSSPISLPKVPPTKPKPKPHLPNSKEAKFDDFQTKFTAKYFKGICLSRYFLVFFLQL